MKKSEALDKLFDITKVQATRIDLLGDAVAELIETDGEHDEVNNAALKACQHMVARITQLEERVKALQTAPEIGFSPFDHKWEGKYVGTDVHRDNPKLKPQNDDYPGQGRL